MAIVGYGDIGSAVAKKCKQAFGMRILGIDKFPNLVAKDKAQWCDEVVGLDKYDQGIAEADYVLTLLPTMKSTDNFFNHVNCFSKMKKSAIFMNIGRGTTVNEEELAEALNSGKIGGAVLDVFKKEPLVKESMLWTAKNLFMTPHCADQDSEWLFRSLDIFEANLLRWMQGKPLNNIMDK